VQYNEQNTFHARHSATGKTYLYRAYTDYIADPFLSDKRFYVKNFTGNLPDQTELQTIADLLIGTHDFGAFRKTDKHNPPKTTVRTIHKIDFEYSCDGGKKFLDIRVTGDGFLYNMVRIIAGTLLGRVPPENIRAALCNPDNGRRLLGITAPPHGLYLEKVHYETER
jgi:tRNA pseudouridine38-40 synthase